MGFDVKKFQIIDENSIELFHLYYRWANIVFVTVLLLLNIKTVPSTAQVIGSLAAVIFYTVLLTLNHKKIHQYLLKFPPLLVVDFVFVNIILALNGGYRSPYLLHSYAPLLVASYFFLFQGAAVGAILHASKYSFFLMRETIPRVNLYRGGVSLEGRGPKQIITTIAKVPGPFLRITASGSADRASISKIPKNAFFDLLGKSGMSK